MKPSEAYAKFQNGEIKGPQLMRSVIEYEEYLLPGSPNHAPLDAYFGSAEEKSYHLFEDSDHFTIWQEKMRQEPLFVGPFRGCDVIPQLADDLSFLNINPDSDEVFHYRSHQFSDMKKLAASVAIEKAFHEVERADELFDRLKKYEEFRMLFRSGDEGGMQLVLAPDEQGRKLIPIFTAEDCFQVWMDQMIPVIQKDLRAPYVITRKGEDLFAELAGYSTDGIVFNPVGYSRPKAFAMQFCSVVANRS